MTALAADRNAIRFGDHMPDSPNAMPVKANVRIYGGAGVVNSAGYLAPASTATGLITMGVARKRYDNTGGSNAALTGEVDQGDFLFVNDGSDPVVIADIGSDCYWTDDQTVSHTASGKSRAGKVVQINPAGYTGVVVRVAAGM
jgi:hypothetical protein